MSWSKKDYHKIDATTEDDVVRHMREDDEDPTAELGVFIEDLPSDEIRDGLGMTQIEFANGLRIPVATMRNWIRDAFDLTPPPHLIRFLSRDPKHALKALAPERKASLAKQTFHMK